ncbi:hypothetical protein, partial [Streptomyces sp. NPDC055060]
MIHVRRHGQEWSTNATTAVNHFPARAREAGEEEMRLVQSPWGESRAGPAAEEVSPRHGSLIGGDCAVGALPWR